MLTQLSSQGIELNFCQANGFFTFRAQLQRVLQTSLCGRGIQIQQFALQAFQLTGRALCLLLRQGQVALQFSHTLYQRALGKLGIMHSAFALVYGTAGLFGQFRALLATGGGGLVMLAASPRFVRGEDWAAGMEAAVFRNFASELGRDYRGTLDRFLMLEAQGSDHVREELKLLRAEVFAHGEPAADVLCEGLGLLEDSDLRAALPSLAMPSLWLAGRRDRLVAPAAMRAAADAAPGGRFVQVESGGHAPFLTHADEVTDALLAFAADCPP